MSIAYPLMGRTTRGSSGTDLTRDIPHDYRRQSGAYLRDLRTKRGLTQQQLGEQIGVGFTAVSAIENGRVSVPPDKYELLVSALGVPRQEFGKIMLRFSNPWAYALIFGAREQALKDELAAMPSRYTDRTGGTKPR